MSKILILLALLAGVPSVLMADPSFNPMILKTEYCVNNLNGQLEDTQIYSKHGITHEGHHKVIYVQIDRHSKVVPFSDELSTAIDTCLVK